MLFSLEKEGGEREVKSEREGERAPVGYLMIQRVIVNIPRCDNSVVIMFLKSSYPLKG